MRIINRHYIPDRSRPGLPTTASTTDQQGGAGKYATAEQRRKRGKRRGGRKRREKKEKYKTREVTLRIGTLNVGTMNGKGREIVDMMERRRIDILCIQETRWKGSKSRQLGDGYKLIYYGKDNKRNGVGVVLKSAYAEGVLGVERISDRVMSLKVDVEGLILNVTSAYGPQTGCTQEDKDKFWRDMDATFMRIPEKR